MHGESKLNAVRDGLRVLRTIVSERLRAQRRRPTRTPGARSSASSSVVRSTAQHSARSTGLS